MEKKISILNLEDFSLFPEYFIAISSIYILIVMTLITYNVYGLMVQKALSECIALLLLMTCYILFNDHLLPMLVFVEVEEADLPIKGPMSGVTVLAHFINEFKHILPNNIHTFGGAIIEDYLSIFSKLIVCFSASIYFYIISNFLKYQKLIAFEYLLITLFAVLGLVLVCSSNDLVISYLAIELSSLAFYILAAFKKNSNYSIESGLKYFITGAVSSAFFLLGCSIIYGMTCSINFNEFKYLFDILFPSTPYSYYSMEAARADYYPSVDLVVYIWKETGLSYLISGLHTFIDIGLSLIFFSLFIKLGLAPFHLWTLDVYEGSPTSSAFFFAVISKFSIFVLLIRVGYHNFCILKEYWAMHSLIVATLSIFVGCFGALQTRKLKTLLAYSSISHMGFALLTLSSTVTKIFCLELLFFYLIIYLISGLAVWFIILALRLKRKTSKDKISKELGDVSLLSKSNPALAFSFTLTMFSLAGIPPMIGFLPKFGVFLSIINSKYTFLFAIISILCTVISTFYYIRIIKVLYFENILVGKLYYPLDSQNVLILSLLIFLLVFLFINPTFLYLYIKKTIECFLYTLF